MIATGTAAELSSFETTITAMNLGIYQIEAIDEAGNVIAPVALSDEGADVDVPEDTASAPADSSAPAGGSREPVADNTALIIVIVIAAVILATLIFCIVMLEYAKRRKKKN